MAQVLGTDTDTSPDPFAAQRTSEDNPFSKDDREASLSPPAHSTDRRMSKEWDASKVPPSRFQKPEGSLYATPSSRDGHIKSSRESDRAYFQKLKEKGWNKKKK